VIFSGSLFVTQQQQQQQPNELSMLVCTGASVLYFDILTSHINSKCLNTTFPEKKKYLGPPSSLFHSGSMGKNLYTFLMSPYVLHAPLISFLN